MKMLKLWFPSVIVEADRAKKLSVIRPDTDIKNKQTTKKYMDIFDHIVLRHRPLIFTYAILTLVGIIGYEQLIAWWGYVFMLVGYVGLVIGSRILIDRFALRHNKII